MAKQTGLGRGLDALFEANEANVTGQLMTLRLIQIEPNRDQPRTHFDQDALQELCESIKIHGVIQPIIVKSTPTGTYEIVAGERRWRAARMAQLSEIPAIVMDLSEERQMQLAMIENLQREDLSPLEEAAGYRTLIDKYGLTQEQLAELMGKSRPAIANSLRLLALPQEVKKALMEKKISTAHAKALAGVEDAEDTLLLLGKISNSHITSRRLEEMVKELKLEKQREQLGNAEQADENIRHRADRQENWGTELYRVSKELESALEKHLKTRVKIKAEGDSGKLTIDFSSIEELKLLADSLLK